MRTFVWTVKWSYLGSSKGGPSVNVTADNIQRALGKGRRWLVKEHEEHSGYNPEDCELVAAVRRLELG